MRLRTLTWASDMALLVQAAKDLGIDLEAWCISELDPENVDECIQSLLEAEAIVLHPSQNPLFDRVIEGIGKKAHVISFGFDPSLWSFSNVSPKIVTAVNAYVVYGGLANITNMLKYIGRELLGYDYDYEPPVETLWQGLYHSRCRKGFFQRRGIPAVVQANPRAYCRHTFLQDLLGQWRPGPGEQADFRAGEGL